MVPNGWKLTSLGMVCSGNLQTGPFGSQLHAHEYTAEGIPVLMPKDLNDFRANYESAAKIPQIRANDLSKHLLKSGDILFSRRGDVSRFALIEDGDQIGLCGTGCLKATPNPEHSSKFLSYFLQKDAVKRWLEQNAVGQTMPNMNTSILSELPLMVASSKDEEEKIAKILSTWDKAISTTERLIDNSKQQKKALMQQLLTGKKRLLDDSGKPFESEWEEVTVDQLCQVGRGRVISKKEINENHGQYPVYSSQTMNNGVMGSIGSYDFDGEYATWTTDGVNAGTVFYRKGKFNCTNVCGTLKPKDLGVLNTQFLALSLSLVTYRYVSHTLANPKLMNGVMKSVAFSIPCIQEQEKIAAVLSNADQEIELLQQQLADLKQEKKALMQQLLTGKRRVKVDDKEVV